MTNTNLDHYELRLGPARAAFENGRTLRAVLADDVDPERLATFFIHFCALGVQMTEPVEGWIRRAGQRCREVGFRDLGDALVTHARHEANHDEMMAADARQLVARWNATHDRHLDADALLSIPPTPGIRRYVEVHEAVIEGDAPYGQLAIEYEIERLSVTCGPKVLAQCERVLGREALASLSFLEEHVAVDEGHTKFNRAQMDRLLSARPELAPAMVEAGTAALAAYSAFFSDCLLAADRWLSAPSHERGAQIHS